MGFGLVLHKVRIMSKKESLHGFGKGVHFSIDDVLNSLLWLENNGKNSVFEARIFQLARWLYESYGIPTTYNCFFENERGSLRYVSDKYKKQISDAGFMFFSFHGKNPCTDYNEAGYKEAYRDYMVVLEELKRIAGEESISGVIRTHFFHGSKEAVEAFGDCGARLLLTADDDRGSYDLAPAEENEARKGVYKKGNKGYLATDIRLESVSLERLRGNRYPSEKPIVIFTHEWYAPKEEAREKIELMLESLKGR